MLRQKLSEEGISGVKEWRLQHPRAIFKEIELARVKGYLTDKFDTRLYPVLHLQKTDAHIFQAAHQVVSSGFQSMMMRNGDQDTFMAGSHC